LVGLLLIAPACGDRKEAAAPTQAPTSTPGPPAGDKIAFLSRRDGHLEVYVMNSDGSCVTGLTDNPAEDASPA
jgi:hypothetical protein